MLGRMLVSHYASSREEAELKNDVAGGARVTPDPFYYSLHCRRQHATDTRGIKPRAAPLSRRCDSTPPTARRR